EWCWCVCDPAVCWESECENLNEARLHYNLISSGILGTGNCNDNEEWPPKDNTECIFIPWTRECGRR
ncbi:MAG: hypothetical protein ACPLX7_10280, partial [Candidatus Kapaibacteriota bacterium]